MKNKILWFIEGTAIMMALLFASCMDSENIVIPALGFLLCLSWMCLFEYVNGGNFDWEDDENGQS